MSFERSTFAQSLYQSGSSPSKDAASPGTPRRPINGTNQPIPVTPFSNIIHRSPGFRSGNSSSVNANNSFNNTFTTPPANSTANSTTSQSQQYQYHPHFPNFQSPQRVANDLRTKISNIGHKTTSSPANSSTTNASSPKTPIQTPTSASAPNTPSSPVPNTFKSSTPSSVPTGVWEHPSLKEIRKRTINKELVLNKVLRNGGVFVVLLGIESVARRLSVLGSRSADSSSAGDASSWLESLAVGDYLKYFIWLIYVLCIYNIVTGISLLIKPQEKFEDLPITPSQRKLLGLPDSPKSSKVSPSPPRYLKSSPQARISPRGSSLSRTTPITSSSLSPLSKISTNANSGTTLMSSSPSDKSPVVKTASANIANPIANNTTTISTTAAAVSSPTPTKIASTSSPSSVSFTPTGRYIYLSESSPRRTSGLARNI